MVLRELSIVFNLPQRPIEQSLKDAFSYDWSADPLSLGAYSHIPVGMTDSAKELAKPIKDTIFFAGELFAPPGEEGTVHGALASGKTAAEKMTSTL